MPGHGEPKLETSRQDLCTDSHRCHNGSQSGPGDGLAGHTHTITTRGWRVETLEPSRLAGFGSLLATFVRSYFNARFLKGAASFWQT